MGKASNMDSRDWYHKYLPVSPIDRDWGLCVTAGGFTLIPPHTPYPPQLHPEMYHFGWENGRVLPEYQFIYISRGRGVFETEGAGAHRLRGGDLFILFPGVWHRYRPSPDTGWDEHWVSFHGDYADRLVSKGFFSPDTPVLRIGFDQGLLNLYARLVETLRAETIGYQQVLAALTVEVMAQTRALFRAAKSGSREGNRIVQKARFILEKNAGRLVDARALAAELRVSYSRFRHLFKDHTGLSPKQYHTELRVEKAKRLLNQTETSVKEIATDLGFSSPYHFMKMFKRKAGMSPSEWRAYSRGKGRR